MSSCRSRKLDGLHECLESALSVASGTYFAISGNFSEDGRQEDLTAWRGEFSTWIQLMLNVMEEWKKGSSSIGSEVAPARASITPGLSTAGMSAEDSSEPNPTGDRHTSELSLLATPLPRTERFYTSSVCGFCLISLQGQSYPPRLINDFPPLSL